MTQDESISDIFRRLVMQEVTKNENTRTKNDVTTYLSKEDKQKLIRIAGERDVSVAGLVREIVHDWLKRQKG